MENQQKVYLIMGGSSGIGLSVAYKLAEKGKQVFLVSSSESKLKSAVQSLPGEGHRFFAYDLSDSEHIRDIFMEIQKQKIRLSGMVYSAGVAPLCLLKDNTTQQMEKVFRINVFSMIEAVRWFQMEENSLEGSHIVSVSSITAHGAGYRQTLYGASKAAMISAVKLMARELLNRKILINCVSPGVTDTGMLEELRKNLSIWMKK